MKMISEPKQKMKHSHLLVLTTNSVSRKEMEAVSDILLFLLRYSFLLNDTSKPQNSCVQKTPQFNAPQGNIYMGARYLDPKYSRWISVDPALGEYASGSDTGCGGIFNHVNLNVYHYGGNNPIKYTDPNGNYLEVSDNENGTYTILSGEANTDKNIYIKKDGIRTGDVLGKMLTEHSFFDDDGLVKDAVIDCGDSSGLEFLDDFKTNTPSLFYYMPNALNGKQYDFKDIGKDGRKGLELNQYRHRGMQLGLDENGTKVFGSARDVGNYAAGYLAGKNGLRWSEARLGFDGLQSFSASKAAKSIRLCTEGPATQAAQNLGFNEGYNTKTGSIIRQCRAVIQVITFLNIIF